MPSSPKSTLTTSSTLDSSVEATAPSTEEVAEQPAESACTSEPNCARYFVRLECCVYSTFTCVYT